ncbi:MAG: hypothetical protein JWM21_1352 [Acidobacteria bacterium]|nr:hypothetical protein [Acidobacteriota bacterium]
MKALRGASRSRLVSRVLAGSWRTSDFPPLDITPAELDEVMPLLYGSGAAALGWWRVRNTELRAIAAAEVLHQAYRLQVLQAGIHEEKIERVFRLLADASIEALLIKGWAASGLYPERGLRPYGDIDLVVRPEQYEAASELFGRAEVKDCWIDLHKHISELDDRPVQDLFERSTNLSLGRASVSVLSAEDHLALLAVHLLKHGAWRPLWLCDIGATIESLPATFDWQLCLGRNRTRAGWIAAAIELAHKLLSARIDQVPPEARAANLPEWLVQNVLRQWEQPFAGEQPPMSHPLPMSTVLGRPNMLFEAVRQRWPNPILATVSVNGQFNRIPRLPYQLRNCLARSFRFLFHASANG